MSKVSIKVNKDIFNPSYLPYLKDDTRTQIYFGGSSSGKSYFLAQRLVMDLLQGEHNYLVVRQVATTLKKSVFNEIGKAISFFKVNKLFQINKSDMTITCQNGFQILFSGMDDPEKIKSVTPAKGVITDIWIEEATECDQKAVKQLDKRLRGRSKVKKRLILSFNPILKSHWIYVEYFGGWREDKNIYQDKDLLILKTTYKDNKFLQPDDIYALENEKDKYYYEVYTLGNWGILGAVIFKNWRTEDLAEKAKEIAEFESGCDFGYADDPAAVVKVALNQRLNTLYVFAAEYHFGATNDILAMHIKNMVGDNVVRCDCADPKSIQELRNYGVCAVPAPKPPGSVNFGIQWLQQLQIVIDPKNIQAVSEFQSYKWQEEKDGTVLPKPVDKNNHIIDAIRYACCAIMGQAYTGNGKRKPLPRAGKM